MRKLLFFIFLASGFLNVRAQSGATLFREDMVHEIRIYFDEPYFWDTLQARYDSLTDSNPLLARRIIVDGFSIDSVGVKQKGYFSNWGAGSSKKKPLKIYFNEYISGQDYENIKSLNLANSFMDPTSMRDFLSLKVMRNAGIMASRAAYTRLYLNDTLWGLYTMIEQVGGTFLKEHFESDSGNLYKAIQSELQYLGPNPLNYAGDFEKKSNETINDWSDLINFTFKLNNTFPADFEDTLRRYMDLNAYLKILAFDVFMNNWDSYFAHGRNFYLYHDRLDDRFRWIPWDYNLAWGDDDYEILLSGVADSKPLVTQCLATDNLKNTYFAALCNIKDHHINSDLFPLIDNTAALIRPFVASDPNAFYGIGQFDSSLNDTWREYRETFPGIIDSSMHRGLKRCINERNTQISDRLLALGFDCNTAGIDDINNELRFEVYPNPASSFVFIQAEALQYKQAELYDLSGRLLLRFNIDFPQTRIDLPVLASGVFYLKCFGDKVSSVSKLLIAR